MTEEDLARQLEELFREVGEAHHQAYIETDGDDPEWPLWYADYLRDKLARSWTQTSPRASSSTCSSWWQTSNPSALPVPTGPGTTPRSSSLYTHNLVRFRVSYPAGEWKLWVV